MNYTFYELAGFYFIYSFIGWCAEVCIAAVRKKKFINRGFVSSPFCPIYGTGAVAFAIFLPDLKDNIFFLFLGGTILASFLEFLTGLLLEKIFHKKWWDYSNKRFNFDGYICLQYSLLWGVFAVLLTYFVNPFLASLLQMIPGLIEKIIILTLGIILTLDTIGTALAIRGMQKRLQGLNTLTKSMTHVSHILENVITDRIRKRMQKAFPTLEIQKIEGELKKADKESKQCHLRSIQYCLGYRMYGAYNHFISN